MAPNEQVKGQDLVFPSERSERLEPLASQRV